MAVDKKRVEELATHTLTALIEHAKDGEPVVDKEGNSLGRRFNAQLLRAGIDFIKYEGVHAQAVPGSTAAAVLAGDDVSDELPSFEFTPFPDEPIHAKRQ